MRKTEKGVRILNFLLFLVAFKWRHGSDGVKYKLNLSMEAMVQFYGK